jgi:fructose-bisphosphate aldolase class II
MLVNLATILSPAVERHYGVACFNVFGWEDACAVVDAAAQLEAPVILAANADFREFMPPGVIAAMLRSLAQRAEVPVCVHFDHGYDVDETLRAVDLGFTAVMFDGSQLPLPQNIAGTARVVRYAHAAGCSVEAEIGSVPYAQGRDHIRTELTSVDDAVRLAHETGLDAMAVSVGNVHRLSVPGAIIDFARLAKICAAVTVPLVIHGTSGIRDQDIECLARTRVAKFNIGTVLRQAFGRGLRQTLQRDLARFDRLEIMREVMPAMSAEAQRVIRLLGWQRGAAAGAMAISATGAA